MEKDYNFFLDNTNSEQQDVDHAPLEDNPFNSPLDLILQFSEQDINLFQNPQPSPPVQNNTISSAN